MQVVVHISRILLVQGLLVHSIRGCKRLGFLQGGSLVGAAARLLPLVQPIHQILLLLLGHLWHFDTSTARSGARLLVGVQGRLAILGDVD